MNLNYYLRKAQEGRYAIGHFNISNLDGLLAIVGAVKKLKAPVMIGTSQGEANFIGYKQAVALVKTYQEETGLPIFLNSDHHKNYPKAKLAIDAGYNSIHVDASGLSYEDNIAETKMTVDYAKKINEDISVEGELGAIKGASEIIKEKIVLTQDDYTNPDQVAGFIKNTGIDRLAIAVGNIHGISLDEPGLDIELLNRIRSVAGNTFLVLHAASGIPDDQIKKAIAFGIVNIHVNTELRVAYTSALRKTLQDKPEEVTPYKLSLDAIYSMQAVVEEKIILFGSAGRAS